MQARNRIKISYKISYKLDTHYLICNSTCMATKTIALDSRVYDRLARHRRQSESFSKAIDRLLEEIASAHTVAEVLARLDEQPPLSEVDAAAMSDVVRENRDSETWPSHDLS